jgi:hypothetical protein
VTDSCFAALITAPLFSAPLNIMPPETKQDGADAAPYAHLQLGVWQVLRAKKTVMNFYSDAPPLLVRFLRELYMVSPGLLVLALVLSVWSSIESTFSYHVSLRLMKTVSYPFTNIVLSKHSRLSGLQIESAFIKSDIAMSEAANRHTILQAAAVYLLFAALGTSTNWLR